MTSTSNELAERVAQRLCHDFAGPVGAIVTALDLLDGSGDEEIHALIGESARTLSASLRLHRLVFGPAGGDLNIGEARSLLLAWAATRADLKVDWAINAETMPAPRAGLLLGLALLAGEAAPRGGTLRISPDGAEIVAAQLRFEPHVAEALVGEADRSLPGTALSGLLAGRALSLGLRITAEPGDRGLRLVLRQGSATPR